MGLFNNFAAIRDSMFEAARRRRPGRKPDAGEIYRAIATEFKAGKWADHTKLMARMEEKDEADRAATLEELTAKLLASIRARGKMRPYSLAEIVEWASEHLLDDVGSLEAAEVPGAAALSMLLWAKKNESRFRSLYDNKRMLSKAQLKKWVANRDSDRATTDLIADLLKGRERATGNEGVV
jgi:hypothetical protein